MNNVARLSPTAADEQWMKFAGIILWKLKGREPLDITEQDVEDFGKAFGTSMPTIVVSNKDSERKITFQVMSEAAALEAAIKARR